MSYKIEKNVPLPPAGGCHVGLREVLQKMKVGDSLKVSDKPRGTLASLLVKESRRAGSKFTTRSQDDGIRVWRLS